MTSVRLTTGQPVFVGMSGCIKARPHDVMSADRFPQVSHASVAKWLHRGRSLHSGCRRVGDASYHLVFRGFAPLTHVTFWGAALGYQLIHAGPEGVGGAVWCLSMVGFCGGFVGGMGRGRSERGPPASWCDIGGGRRGCRETSTPHGIRGEGWVLFDAMMLETDSCQFFVFHSFNRMEAHLFTVHVGGVKHNPN